MHRQSPLLSIGWLTVLLAASGAFASRPEDLTTLLEPIRAKQRVPALAGAILDGDGLVAIGAVGVRKRGSRQEVSVDDQWHLASCTKAMTATLIARLIERQLLSWDASIAGSLPELGASLHRDYRPVRIDQLLAHRGGVPGDLTRLPIWSWLWNHRGTTEEERARLVAVLLEQAPEAPPGQAFLYSNGGYTIAGAMAEHAGGDSWESLIQREVFAPLGMQSSGFGAPGTREDLDQPWGHGDEGRHPVPPGPRADNPPAIGPAATVHASLPDWARFVGVHLAGARGLGSYLAPETFRKLHTPPAGQDYALGWGLGRHDWARGRVLSHRGSNTMWMALVRIAPERGFAVLATTNQAGTRGSEAVDEAAMALIQRQLERSSER